MSRMSTSQDRERARGAPVCRVTKWLGKPLGVPQSKLVLTVEPANYTAAEPSNPTTLELRGAALKLVAKPISAGAHVDQV